MRPKKIMLILCFVQTGCAHYFRGSSEYESLKKSHLTNPICIEIGENSIKNEKAVFLDENHKTHGKIITKIKEKYPEAVYDCSALKKTTINYSNVQEKKKIDYFVLSLGIIPIIAESVYQLEVFDENKVLTYKSQVKGNVVLSIFFVPFFFLHKHDYEIIFDELDKYLQEQLKFSNKPS